LCVPASSTTTNQWAPYQHPKGPLQTEAYKEEQYKWMFAFMWRRCDSHMLCVSSEVYKAMKKINPMVVSVMTTYCFTSGIPTFQRNIPPAYSG
jgi:hypothetical protein